MERQDVAILTLPEEVIIPIFQLLPQFEVLHNIRLTCKTWNHYSRDGILWRRIRAQDFIRAFFRIGNFMRFLCDISHSVEELEIDVTQIYNLQKTQFFFPRLRSLKLYAQYRSEAQLSGPIDQLSDYSLKAITRMYPALEELHLTYFSTDFDMISCPKDLKKLVLGRWFMVGRSNYKPPRNVGEHFKNVTHLGLCYCNLYNQTVLALLSWLPCLESIDLSYTSNSEPELEDDEKIPDKPRCSNRIHTVNMKLTSYMFFPHVFMYIVKSANERIRYIDISNDTQKSLTLPCLHNIAEMCRQLDTLAIGECNNLEHGHTDLASYDPDKHEINRAIRHVASNNQHLSTIKMNFFEAIIEDETVLHVFQNCSKLQWIEILGCESLSDNTLDNIANKERLHVLKISNCQLVTPTGIGKVLERCRRLKTLHVEGIETIQLILERKSVLLMNCLTTLSLAHCFELSDECLDQIAKCCPILRSINLTCCHRITDVGFVQFVQQCPSITDILLKDNSKHRIGLSGHAFAAVANCKNNLERLTIGPFTKITCEAVHELICKCPKLTEILFDNTGKIWNFDVVIAASKLHMTPAETQKFTDKLKRKLERLPLDQEDEYVWARVSAIRLHRDHLSRRSRRNKAKLFTDWDKAGLPE